MVMEDSDSDIDTSDKDTDGISMSSSHSAEAFVTNNEESDVNAEGASKIDQELSDGATSEDKHSEAVTDEELEREAKELEEKVRRLRDEEVLLKQMLDGTVTKQQLKNRLNFYKFSGLYVSKCTDSKLYVDLTPTLYGKRSGCCSYYIQFRILSDDCFKMEKAHLPFGIREQLHKEEFSVDELRRFLDYIQHICECTEIKRKQFSEAEKEPVSAEDGSVNVSHTIFVTDNCHVDVGFRPKDQKYSHKWLTVLLLYNDKEIYFEPNGIRVESEGFSKEVEQRVHDLFVSGCNQELKLTVWKAKNFISNVLQYMNEQESSSEYFDSP